MGYSVELFVDCKEAESVYLLKVVGEFIYSTQEFEITNVFVELKPNKFTSVCVDYFKEEIEENKEYIFDQFEEQMLEEIEQRKVDVMLEARGL